MMLQTGQYIPDPVSFAVGQQLHFVTFSANWDRISGRKPPSIEATHNCFFSQPWKQNTTIDETLFSGPGGSPWLDGVDVYMADAKTARGAKQRQRETERGLPHLRPPSNLNSTNISDETSVPETQLTRDGYEVDDFVRPDDDADDDDASRGSLNDILAALRGGDHRSRRDAVAAFDHAPPPSVVQNLNSDFIENLLAAHNTQSTLPRNPLLDDEAKEQVEHSSDESFFY